MPSIRIHLDEATLRALNRVAEKRQRSAFIRGVIVQAIVDAEEARTRRAYEEQPDSESEADDWSNADPWE
jgi:predicted transcriptional regulator